MLRAHWSFIKFTINKNYMFNRIEEMSRSDFEDEQFKEAINLTIL